MWCKLVLAVFLLSTEPVSASRSASSISVREGAEWFGRRCRAPENGNFHYQIQYEDGSQHAIRLAWNHSSPTVTVHDGMVWTVSLTDGEPRQVEWHVEPSAEGGPVVPPTVLSATSFRLLAGEPRMPGIFEIGQGEGDLDASFAGGIYLPEHLVLSELADAETPEEGRALEVHSRLSADDHALAAAGGVVHSGARVGMIAGAVVGTVAVGAIGMVSSVLALGTLAGDVAFTLLAGSGGLVAGGAAGRVAGAVVSLPGAAVSGAMALVRGNRQLQPFVASEHIFNQLKCHRAFTDCGGDVFVLEGQECPGE